MIKQFYALLLMLCLLAPALRAQSYGKDPCATNPPSCIQNNDFVGPTASGNMNSSTALTMPGWYVSHGTPSINYLTNSPSSPGSSIWMWSYSGQGEGIFACYNFQSGVTYNVCLWVQNTNLIDRGRLYLFATTGLISQNPVGFGGPPPTPSTSQLIDSSFVNDTTWTLLSYTFTPTSNFTQLWVYPFMNHDPIGGRQYELRVDNIRVSKAQSNNITIKSSKDSIGCGDSTVLTVVGAPSGATIGWYPSTGLSSNTGTSVTASPCGTTTYTVSINANGKCPLCERAGQITVIVEGMNPNNIHNDGPVDCGNTINLWYSPTPPCNATYTWLDPHGNVISTSSTASVPNASTADAGTYTLQITTSSGCTVTYTTNVVVNGCCEAKADFTWDEQICNPISFHDISTVTGTIVSWYWDFGDGATSTVPNPVHAYATAGVYTVCLTITVENNGKYCRDRICKDVQVCDNTGKCVAKADFGYTAVSNPPFTIQFTDYSSGTGTICAYSWDFGDGSTSTASNPSHTYSAPGTYTVCLNVVICMYDANGNLISKCEDKVCYQVQVDKPTKPVQLNSGIKVNAAVEPANIQVMPNPATSNIRIQVTGIMNPVVTIRTMNGDLIGKAQGDMKNAIYNFDVSRLAPGTYVIQVVGSNLSKSVKFMKQ